MVRLALLSAFCPSAAKGREESELFPPNAPLKLVASLVALVAIVAILLACLLRSLRRLLSKYLLYFFFFSSPITASLGFGKKDISIWKCLSRKVDKIWIKSYREDERSSAAQRC